MDDNITEQQTEPCERGFKESRSEGFVFGSVVLNVIALAFLFITYAFSFTLYGVALAPILCFVVLLTQAASCFSNWKNDSFIVKVFEKIDGEPFIINRIKAAFVVLTVIAALFLAATAYSAPTLIPYGLIAIFTTQMITFFIGAKILNRATKSLNNDSLSGDLSTEELTEARSIYNICNNNFKNYLLQGFIYLSLSIMLTLNFFAPAAWGLTTEIATYIMAICSTILIASRVYFSTSTLAQLNVMEQRKVATPTTSTQQDTSKKEEEKKVVSTTSKKEEEKTTLSYQPEAVLCEPSLAKDHTCLFNAVIAQLEKNNSSEEKAPNCEALCEQIMNYTTSNNELYNNFVNKHKSNYKEKIYWEDHWKISVLAKLLKKNIIVIIGYEKESKPIVFKQKEANGTLYLIYNGSHYQSLTSNSEQTLEALNKLVEQAEVDHEQLLSAVPEGESRTAQFTI